jgi:hypothetical protein
VKRGAELKGPKKYEIDLFSTNVVPALRGTRIPLSRTVTALEFLGLSFGQITSQRLLADALVRSLVITQ